MRLALPGQPWGRCERCSTGPFPKLGGLAS